MCIRDSSIRSLEEDIVALTTGLIDEVIDRGTCDVSQAFTIPLPSAIFLRLLGLPQHELPDFLTLKDQLIRPEGPTEEARLKVRTDASQRVYALFEAVLDDRRRE